MRFSIATECLCVAENTFRARKDPPIDAGSSILSKQAMGIAASGLPRMLASRSHERKIVNRFLWGYPKSKKKKLQPLAVSGGESRWGDRYRTP